MASDFLIVHRSILPDYLEQVIYARELIASHECSTVTEAVKKAGISRNTFYKYKDHVFRPEETSMQRKAVITFSLNHEPGALSTVLNVIGKHNASVITISQAVPVNGRASVTITLDITACNYSVQELVKSLGMLAQIRSIHMDSME